MDDMHHALLYQKISSWITYIAGGGTFLGSVMDFLNQNAAGLGVLIAGAGLLANLYFQRQRNRMLKDDRPES